MPLGRKEVEGIVENRWKYAKCLLLFDVVKLKIAVGLWYKSKVDGTPRYGSD